MLDEVDILSGGTIERAFVAFSMRNTHTRIARPTMDALRVRGFQEDLRFRVAAADVRCCWFVGNYVRCALEIHIRAKRQLVYRTKMRESAYTCLKKI